MVATSRIGAVRKRERFERARSELLQEAVRRDRLRGDVSDMRERMRRELSRGGAGDFDLKQDRMTPIRDASVMASS